MSWLSAKMTEPQQYVWARRADIDVALAGSSRWTRLSELPTDQFAYARRILDWMDMTLVDGASAATVRLMLPTDTHTGCMAELSLDVLDALGIPPPPAGRHLHEGGAIDIALIDDLDGDDEALI